MPAKRSAKPARPTTRKAAKGAKQPDPKRGKAASRKRASGGKAAPARGKGPAGGRKAEAAPRQRTVTPYLVVPDAARAIAWYAEAFGAKELSRNMAPGGKIMHAALQIGDSQVYLSDVFPGSDMKDPKSLGGTCVNLHIHHKEIDRIWQQAVDAGANVTMQLANQFWGQRYGKVIDPFGHSWAFGYEADVSDDERERMQAQAMQLFASGANPVREP